jgi:hypothetical protein
MPISNLDLKAAGLERFYVTLPVRLRPEAIRQLRRLAKDEGGHIWTGTTYRSSSGERHGVTLSVHLPGKTTEPTILDIDYRRREAPRKSKVPFSDAWALVHSVAESTQIKAIAAILMEFPKDVPPPLPVVLPLTLPALASVGEIAGVRVVRQEKGSLLYQVVIDQEPDGTIQLVLTFTKEVPLVATALDDLMAAGRELLSVILVGGLSNAGG